MQSSANTAPLDAVPENGRNPATNYRRTILAILLLAGLSRVWLAWSGGQFFWPDEVRYNTSRDAVAYLANGKVLVGFTSAVASGDHVGFKLLGMIPAGVERWLGVKDPRIPGVFFATLSWAVLWLLWGCAGRLGLSPRAQLWTMATAGASGALLIYARHLLPYDAALVFALSSLYIGWRQAPALKTSLGVGFLAGTATLVYLGYWLLAGTVVLLHLVRLRESWGRRCARLATAGLGAFLPLLGVWVLDRFGEGKMLVNARQFSTTVFQGDFGQGWRLVWEYYWHAEGFLLGFWVLTVLGGLWFGLRKWRTSSPAWPAWGLVGGGLLVVYTGLVLLSDVLPKFVVYGRTARQLTPFFCLAAGLATAAWLDRSKRARGWSLLLGVALAANAGWRQWPVFAQVFPTEFRRAGERLLATLPAAAPGQSYYRYANVDSYVYEADQMPVEPAATLLACTHPYEFAPYLYEGQTATQRARRRAADHRMRLVRIDIPPAWLVSGDDYGQISMTVSFAEGRAGLSEPILSIGAVGNGELVFVRYTGARELRLGLESMGIAVALGAPMTFEPGQPYEIGVFTGSLLPPEAQGKISMSKRLYYQNLALLRFAGRDVLNQMTTPYSIKPEEVYAGYNHVRATSAITAFSGTVSGVRRGGYPAVPESPENESEIGALRCVVKLPGFTSGAAEPLVTVGTPGDANLGYVRVLPSGKIKVGAELWGVGAYDSPELAVETDKPVEIVFFLPAFFPPAGDTRWGQVPMPEQEILRTRVTILVNGQTALTTTVRPYLPRQPVVFYGKNPLGGSWVNPVFTGTLLQISRLPLGTH